MTWKTVNIKHNDVDFIGLVNGSNPLEFSLSAVSGVAVGDKLTVGSDKFEVTEVTDTAGRGELLRLITKEVKNDKPKARGTKPKSGEPDMERESDDGRTGED